MEKRMTVSEFKNLVAESTEFKPKLGPKVVSGNKENNGKAYSDAKKRAKDYDGGLTDGADYQKGKAKYEKIDGNKTTLDYNPENVTDSYKARVKAQALGYTSELEQKNGLEKSGDFSGNEQIYDGIKDCGKKMHDNEAEFKRTGLQARMMPPETFERGEMYESKEGFDMRNMINALKEKSEKKPQNENKHLKTAYFKRTAFLNEEHMFSRIPDEFKNEGEKFRMKDKTGNEYMVEWYNGNPHIVDHKNKNGLNESVEHMKSLYEYKSSDTKTTLGYRANEGFDNLKKTLDKVRKITEK